MQTDALSAAAMLALALLIDVTFGEYPSFAHPVVWIGALISLGMRLAPASGWRRQFFFGTILTLAIVGISAAAGCLVMWAASANPIIEILTGAILLKSAFALRALGGAAFGVVKPLENGNLPEARLALRSLCSRDPSQSTQEQLLAATIESLAENASDSVIAPLFYFLLLGVPGALAYRAINTLDARIGYRGQYEALGKFAARLDDVANFIPARLTALLFLLIGSFFGGDVRHGWQTLRRDGARTPSPNAGRPMAVMAGLLNVQLDKPGVYALGDPLQPLDAGKVRRAWRIVLAASLVSTGLIALLLLAAGAILPTIAWTD